MNSIVFFSLFLVIVIMELPNLNIDDNKKTFIVFGVFLIVLIFILFYNTFDKKNFYKIKELDYDGKIEHIEVPSCYDIEDPMEQYILSDYYIASSYNTPLIGNQKYGYLSLDMVSKVLDAGARYIELEICKSKLNRGAEPIIATGSYQGDWVNSLNYLDVLEVLTLIHKKAFMIGDKKVNHPLFVYLKLRTSDEITLGKLADLIKQIFKKVMVPPEKYTTFPISLERVCNLQRRVIFLSNDDYYETKLTDVIVNTSGFLNRIFYNELDTITLTNKNKKNYNRLLSRKSQDLSIDHFKKKYPDIKSIQKNQDFLDTLIKDEKIVDTLSNYNKVGMTVVVPHKDEDTFSLNYDLNNPISYGCQFVSLNYQVYDEHMEKYLDFFKDGYFKLKPESLRFHRTPKSFIDINKLFVEPPRLIYDDIPNFLYEFKNELITIESYNITGLFLSQSGENCVFRGIPAKNNGKHLIEQGFVVLPANNKHYPSAVMLATANNLNNVITREGRYFYIKQIDLNDEDEVKMSTFIPIKSKCEGDEYISFATLSEDSIKVIGNYNGVLKEFVKSDTTSNIAKTCFKIKKLKHQKQIAFKHSSGLYMTTTNTGILMLKGRKLSDNHKFMLEGNYMTESISLKAPNGKYVSLKSSNRLHADANEVVSDELFKLVRLSQGFVLKNDRNLFLMTPGRGILKMDMDNELLSPEKVDKDGKVISVAVYSPPLGMKKIFSIRINYILDYS